MLITWIADLVSAARKFAEYRKPPKQDFLSVETYFDDDKPCTAAESYIYFKEDLMTLKPERDETWLDFMVWRILRKLSCRFTRVCLPLI
jgi:hypothetical protein